MYYKCIDPTNKRYGDQIFEILSENDKMVYYKTVGQGYIIHHKSAKEYWKRNFLEIKESYNHYQKGSIQPIDYIEANNMCFNSGNIIKYVTRYKYKNGIEDLYKARDYLDRLIELEKKKEISK